MVKERPSKEELERLYWEEGMSQRKVAKKYRMSDNTLICLMNKLNIKRRKTGGSPERSPWPNFESWKAYGVERGYELSNPENVKKGNKEERSWYNKGSKKRWILKFDFNRMRLDGKWEEFQEWERYGLEREFNKRNLNSLRNSENAEERSWYCKGNKKKWFPKFEFAGLKRKKRSVKSGQWKDLQFALQQAKLFLEKHPEYEELPRARIMYRLGVFTLGHAIYTYHGGFPVFRQLLNEYMGRTSVIDQPSLLEQYIGGEND
ncbi:hypothetical protein HYV88_02920 [Candidatus Woesearchaeota archaeon]|nr:hypothetical protein [Candidatus Woesearchaeota archaeon]